MDKKKHTTMRFSPQDLEDIRKMRQLYGCISDAAVRLAFRMVARGEPPVPNKECTFHPPLQRRGLSGALRCKQSVAYSPLAHGVHVLSSRLVALPSQENKKQAGHGEGSPAREVLLHVQLVLLIYYTATASFSTFVPSVHQSRETSTTHRPTALMTSSPIKPMNVNSKPAAVSSGQMLDETFP